MMGKNIDHFQKSTFYDSDKNVALEHFSLVVCLCCCDKYSYVFYLFSNEITTKRALKDIDPDIRMVINWKNICH